MYENVVRNERLYEYRGDDSTIKILKGVSYIDSNSF